MLSLTSALQGPGPAAPMLPGSLRVHQYGSTPECMWTTLEIPLPCGSSPPPSPSSSSPSSHHSLNCSPLWPCEHLLFLQTDPQDPVFQPCPVPRPALLLSMAWAWVASPGSPALGKDQPAGGLPSFRVRGDTGQCRASARGPGARAGGACAPQRPLT